MIKPGEKKIVVPERERKREREKFLWGPVTDGGVMVVLA
jgi:hypothetical protein